MPSPEVDNCCQAAVLWPVTGSDAYGMPKVGSPVAVRVVWTTKRSLVVDAQGNTVALDATAKVLQKVDIGSHLWLAPQGTPLSNAVAVFNALPASTIDQELMEVKTYSETPDAKNRFSWKSVGMMRLHNAPQ